MRHYLKSLILTGVSFYAVYSFIPSVNVGIDPKNVAIIVGGLFILSKIIDPIFSLVLLPINFLTFGLVSVILNIAFFYAMTKFLPGFFIAAYDFPGANLEGFIIPRAYLSPIMTVFTVGLAFTFLQKVLRIIFE